MSHFSRGFTAVVVCAGMGMVVSPDAQTPDPPAVSDVVVVAHRGLAAGYPENTLAAFRHVIAAGVDAIELDLRHTADGEVVVLHDDTVDRTTDGRGELARLTLREVKALDAGGHASARFWGERVPTYREVLDLAGGTSVHLLLDIKQDRQLNLERVVRLTEAYGAVLRVIVGVRSVDDLRTFRGLNPSLRTLGFVPDVESIPAFANAGIDIVRLWPEWVSADPALVGRVHAAGRSVWVTAGTMDGAGIAALIERGVNGILTDRPDVLLPLVADMRGKLRAREPQPSTR